VSQNQSLNQRTGDFSMALTDDSPLNTTDQNEREVDHQRNDSIRSRLTNGERLPSVVSPEYMTHETEKNHQGEHHICHQSNPSKASEQS
jgi:hypothetical protein